MHTIAVIEHQTIQISDSSTELCVLSVRQAKELEKLAVRLPKGFMTWGRNSVKLSSYCGVLQLSDLTIEVLPKIYGKESEPGSCRLALIRMLVKARQLSLPKGTDANLGLQRYALLDVFIIQFCDQLKVQVLQGLIRNYENIEENLPVIRGRLLVNEQLKHNSAHKERLYCRYDELTADISLNQTIKFTLRLLLGFCKSNRCKKALIELLLSFDGVSDCRVTLDDLNGITFDRNAVRYKALIKQCEMFIRGLAPDVVVGETNTISLLFDMNKLFEAWVASKIRSSAIKRGLILKEQGPRKYLACREDRQKNVFQLRPDISLINNDGAVVETIDVKWKLLDPNENRVGISQADLYQILTYNASYKPQRLSLIYPSQDKLARNYIFKLLNEEGELVVETIEIS